jgi:hypothetical protein
VNTLANRLTLTSSRPLEAAVDHCGTGNRASPRFLGRETYRWDLGYAAQLTAWVCMDCGAELVRYSQLRHLVKPPSRLSWRRDEKYRP